MSNSSQLFGVSSSDPTVRGLATVAMLKANFDARRDHIAMFEPFVRDAVATFPDDDMDRHQVIGAVLSRHGLALPENTMRTLLNRLIKSGSLRRDGGRYFRTDESLSSEDVVRSREKAEWRQRRLAQALIESAKERKVEVESEEQALALVMSFMEAYHVKLAFDEPPDFDGTHQEDTARSPKHVATALFLRDAITAQGEFSEVVQEMLEGFVLQNTLLLKDISQAARQFQDLEVVFDSQILFGAIGLRGPTTETATVELLELLEQTGATVSAFRPTLAEMRRVLAVYEDKLGTTKGREELDDGDLTRHFLGEQFTPADVKEQDALLEVKLHERGISIHPLPDRVAKWTMDERALGRALADKKSGRDNTPRVVHDIDCVAAVLTYRAGLQSESLDDCKAIFVTDSGMTAGHTRNWYREQGGKGFPPILHELSLSNYAWLKRPASAAKLKVHELVALCTAALRPSRQTWEHFVKHLRALEKSGQLSNDEVAAVVASELTRNVLAEAGIDEDSDASSISEVIERVRAQDRKRADAEVLAANEAAKAKSDEIELLRGKFKARSFTVARALTIVVTGLLVAALVAGTVVGLIDAGTGETPSVAAIVLTLVPLSVLGLLGCISGFHLLAWRERAEKWLAKKLESWMLHGRFCPSDENDEERQSSEV